MKGYKKLVTFLCAAAMATSTLSIPVFAANTIDSEPVFADFDSNGGGFPAWIAKITTDEAHGNSYSMSEGWHQGIWSKTFDTKKGTYQFSFDFYTQPEGNVRFVLGPANGIYNSLTDFMYSASSQTLSYYTPTQTNTWNSAGVSVAIPANTWVTVDQIIDLEKETVSCYVDGEKAYEKAIPQGTLDQINADGYTLKDFIVYSGTKDVAIDNIEFEKYEKNTFATKTGSFGEMTVGATSVDIVLENSVDPYYLNAEKIKLNQYEASDVFMKNPQAVSVTVSDATPRAFTLSWEEGLKTGSFYTLDLSAVPGLEGNTFQKPVQVMMAAPVAETVTETLVPTKDFEDMTLAAGAVPEGMTAMSLWATPPDINASFAQFAIEEQNGSDMLKVSTSDKNFGALLTKINLEKETGSLQIKADFGMGEGGGFVYHDLVDMASGTYFDLMGIVWNWLQYNGEGVMDMNAGNFKNFTYTINLDTRAVVANVGGREFTLGVVPDSLDLTSDGLYFGMRVSHMARSFYIDNLSVTQSYKKGGLEDISDKLVANMDFESTVLEGTDANGETRVSPQGLTNWNFWGEEGQLNQSVPNAVDAENFNGMYSIYDNSGDKMLQVAFLDKGYAFSTKPLALAKESGKLIITTDLAYATATEGQIILSLNDMSKSRSNQDEAEYRFLKFTWADGWMNNHNGTQLQWPSVGTSGAVTRFVFEVDLATREVKAKIGGTNYTLTTIPESLDLMSDSLCYTISSNHMGKTIRVDNISVTHNYTVNNLAPYIGGITFEDYNGDAVTFEDGKLAPSVKKLYVPVSFGVTEADVSIALKNKDGAVVCEDFDIVNGVAVMTLDKILAEDSDYTIAIGGEVSNAGGYLFHTDIGAFSVTNLQLVDASGNTLKNIPADLVSLHINADVVNNSSDGDVYFIIATYTGSKMNQVFVEKLPAESGFQDNVDANIRSIGTEEGQLDLTGVDSIQAYAWKSMQTAEPFCDFAAIAPAN